MKFSTSVVNKAFLVMAACSLTPSLSERAYGEEGQEPIKVVKVEETWSLTVGEPNLANGAPQATMTMSPLPNLDGDHFVVTFNHATEPEFVAGGLQLQHWNEEELEQSTPRKEHSLLDVSGEVLSWRQTMSVDDGVLSFQLEDGESDSWGNFGNGGDYRLQTPSSLQDLNGYRPQISLTGSGVNFGGNRVASLTLLKIRWHLSNGQVYELNAPIDIDSDLDPWN